MGRKIKQKTIVSFEQADWPWRLSIDLAPFIKPKVCFLSGKEREYFPEDPGYSRHGVEYSMNCRPSDTPNPSYFPSSNTLQKPVSSKGYGIGGLSSRRFTKHHDLVTPDPGAYQPEISTIPKKLGTKKRSSNIYGNETRPCLPYQPLVFGSSISAGRFEADAKWNCVGVGHYDLKAIGGCKRLTMDTGFGGGSAILVPPTVSRCHYEGFDHCVRCNIPLSRIDYYRSRNPIQVPRAKTSSESTKLPPTRYVSMCRECFCNIMRQGDPLWTKRSLLTDFQKTRHCINIHEHHQLPAFIHKAPCHLIRQLTRREAMMAKYFTDGCDRTIRERTW